MFDNHVTGYLQPVFRDYHTCARALQGSIHLTINCCITISCPYCCRVGGGWCGGGAQTDVLCCGSDVRPSRQVTAVVESCSLCHRIPVTRLRPSDHQVLSYHCLNQSGNTQIAITTRILTHLLFIHICNFKYSYILR